MEEKSVPLVTWTRVIAVKTFNGFQDKGDAAAIIASVTTRCGEDLVVTDSSWKYSTVMETGWETLDFKETGNWRSTPKMADHGKGPWRWKGYETKSFYSEIANNYRSFYFKWKSLDKISNCGHLHV